MTTIADIRKQYPQYSDISDAQLADGFYAKFYSDMPKEEFYKAINFSTGPAKQTPVEQPRTGMQEAGRQAGLTGRTLYEAFTAPATAALDFGAGLYNAGANLVGSESRLPYASQRQAEMLNKMGAPTPETTAEKIAQGGISGLAGQAGMAKAIPAAAGSLARSLPAAAAGGAVAQPAAELTTDITGNPLLGQAVGMGASMVAGGAAGKAGSMFEPKATTFSIPEVRARAAANYTKMDDQGIMLKPSSTQGLVADMQTALKEANYLPANAPQVENVLKEFQKVVSQPMTFSSLDQMRSLAGSLAGEGSPNLKRLSKVMTSSIDDYISSLNGRDVSAGAAGIDDAVKAVMSARKDWRAASKAQVIQDLFDVAEARALNPSASEAKVLQDKLTSLLANKKQAAMFTTAEKNAMKSVVNGGPIDVLASFVSRFNPLRPFGAASSGGGGLVAQDPTVGLGLAGAGLITDTAQGALKRRATRNLIEGVASGTIRDNPNYKYQGLLGGFMSEP
jgi:hypothetical protein